MNFRIALFFIFILSSCDKQDAFDCIRSIGHPITKEFITDNFDEILVNENIELTVKVGSLFSLKIQTGSNMMSDVSYRIQDGILILTDENRCNWIRSYAPTKVTVLAPNLKKITSNTQYEIKSEGVLTYPTLELISENFDNNYLSLGDFNIQIQSENLFIISNNLSQFFISGTTNNLHIGFYSGTTSFFGSNLIAQEIIVSHRSGHDILVHPILSLTGELRSTGNLISVKTPELVDVAQLYTGQLIFLDQ